MVLDEETLLMREHTAARAAMFPAAKNIEHMQCTSTVHISGRGPDDAPPRQFRSYFVTMVDFTGFAPEWPITTSWPYAIRGLRRSTSTSQAEFAALCKISKPTVERWETGKTIPYRGDALQLLTLVRPNLRTPVQAGQALNLAAAAVLPHLTRPTATYAGGDLASLLASGQHDHTDLARPVLEALVSSRILLPVEPSGDALGDTYFPLSERHHHSNDLPRWAHQLIDDLGSASETDRKFFLELARRLAR